MLIREVSNLARNPAVALDARGHVVGAQRTGSGGPRRARRVGVPHARPSTCRPPRGQPTDTTPGWNRSPGRTDSDWTCVASAIRLGKAFEGWVVVLVPEASPGRHDLAPTRRLTEQATAIVGSEMLRQRSVDEAEERARGDFVQALVHGSFSSEHDMRARAEHHDIELDSRFGVFVAPGVLPQRCRQPAASMVRLARYAASVAPHPRCAPTSR